MLEGFFLPEVITRLFVLLGIGGEIFGLSLDCFWHLSKLKFMCPQINFVGKILFHQNRILSQNFLALFLTSSRRFSKLHLMRPGEDFEENYSLFWKTKTFFDYFLFFLPKLIKKPVKTAFYFSRVSSWGKKRLLEKTKQLYINFWDLKRIIFATSANFFEKIVKTDFVCRRNVLKKKFNSSVPYIERKIQGLLARDKNYSQFFP